jgi:hypothetical protein
MGSAPALMVQVEEAWRPLRDAAQGLGLHGLERETSAGWTAGEMLAHVAFWDEAVFGAVTMLFRGQPLPEGWRFGSGYAPESEWPSADVHNAREAAWAREQPPEAIIERLDAGHRQLLAFLETVTAEEIAAHEDYFSSIGRHYREHLPELEALLDGSR